MSAAETAPRTVQVNTWGFPPFKNTSNPDLPTATDRLVYGALNLYRDSAANFQCAILAIALPCRARVGGGQNSGT